LALDFILASHWGGLQGIYFMTALGCFMAFTLVLMLREKLLASFISPARGDTMPVRAVLNPLGGDLVRHVVFVYTLKKAYP